MNTPCPTCAALQDEGLIEEQLQALITAEELSLVNDALVYLPYLRAAEKSIARTMKRLAHTPASYPLIDADKAIGACLTHDFDQAINVAGIGNQH